MSRTFSVMLIYLHKTWLRQFYNRYVNLKLLPFDLKLNSEYDTQVNTKVIIRSELDYDKKSATFFNVRLATIVKYGKTVFHQ